MQLRLPQRADRSLPPRRCRAMPGFGAIAAGYATMAEWGFDYATGPWSANGRVDPPVFISNCSGCGEPVSDRGPGSPRHDETGHGDGYPVLAAAAAGWDAGRPAPG
jgi:hypothetical protein